MKDCRLGGPVGINHAVVRRAEYFAALAGKAAAGRLETGTRDTVELVKVPRLLVTAGRFSVARTFVDMFFSSFEWVWVTEEAPRHDPLGLHSS